jgi:hypothetical protein
MEGDGLAGCHHLSPGRLRFTYIAICWLVLSYDVVRLSTLLVEWIAKGGKTMKITAEDSGPEPLSIFWLLVLPAAACALVSCAGINAKTTSYGSALRLAPVDPAAVQILRTEPVQVHDHLGEIVIESSTAPAPPVAEVDQKLRTEAAKMGADAVIVTVDYALPSRPYVTGTLDRHVVTVHGYKIVGVAIKYR